MSESGGLKSAYELAMERLRKKDEESGETRRELTDADKAAIAEIRSIYQAKLADIELRYQDRAQKLLDPAEREALSVEYRRDRERLSDERERKIERIRLGGQTPG
jgi:hypothetical protein